MATPAERPFSGPWLWQASTNTRLEALGMLAGAAEDRLEWFCAGDEMHNLVP